MFAQVGVRTGVKVPATGENWRTRTAGHLQSGLMANRDHRTLEQFLQEELPAGWVDAARSGDEDRLDRLKDSLDNPGFVRRLGAAGWVAPHWAPEHGGRGLSIDDALGALFGGQA